jgi:prophage regulatory protein
MNKKKPQEAQKNGIASQLISANTFAKMLEISKRTLQRLQSKGELPSPIRLGGSVRWRLDIVKDWIENGCPTQDDLD